ncbi:hypothetical protein AC579_3018 [Pseudocercospora musae]|uniref:Fork-head domain-containing protein n=1 Tax=Pseudocercospora musae TaxID=113226 RepID=A0A139I4Y8_9PEZI|nr:hypothetical protein AC579_3018 [Pseudocercospora musae]
MQQLDPDGQAPRRRLPETDMVGAHSALCSSNEQDLPSRDPLLAKASEEVIATPPTSSPQPSAGLRELRKLFPPRSSTPPEHECASASQDSLKSLSASKLEKDDATSNISGTPSSSRPKMPSQACHKCPSIGGQLFHCTTCARRYHRQCLPLHITPHDIDRRWQCERCLRKGTPKRAAPVDMATATKTNNTYELQHRLASRFQHNQVKSPSTILPPHSAPAVQPRSEASIAECPAAETEAPRAERSSEPRQLDMAPPVGNTIFKLPTKEIVGTPEKKAADDLVEKSFSGAHRPSNMVETGAKKGLIFKRVKKTASTELRGGHQAVPAESSPSFPRRDERLAGAHLQASTVTKEPATENMRYSADEGETLPKVRVQNNDVEVALKTAQKTDIGHGMGAKSAPHIHGQAPHHSSPDTGLASPVVDNIAPCVSSADSVLQEPTILRPPIAKAKRNPITPVPCSICRKQKVPRHPSGRSICTKCKRSEACQTARASVASIEGDTSRHPPKTAANPPSAERPEEDFTRKGQQIEAARAHLGAFVNLPKAPSQQPVLVAADESEIPIPLPTEQEEPAAPLVTLTALSLPQKRKPEPTSRPKESEDAFDLGNSMHRPKNTYWKLISMALCAAPEHRMQPLAVASWVAKNIPGYSLKEGSWANSLKASLIHNNNGELGKQICSVVNVRGSEGTIEKWYELLPGLDFRLMQWDSVLQKPFMQSSPVSPGVLQPQAEGELSASKEVTEPWCNRDRIAKKRLGKETSSSTQPQSYDDGMSSNHEAMNKTCVTVDEKSSEDEPLARVPRRRQHRMRPNMATQDSQDCNGQAGGDPMEVDEISMLLHAAGQSPSKPSDEGARTFEEIDEDSSLAIMPEEEDDQSELREIIRQEESEAAYTERSLFAAWPEYDPRNQFDAAAKIAEIAKRPRKKQLFATPAYYSPLGEQPFLRVRKPRASATQQSPVKRAAKSRAREAQDKIDATSVRTFDTLEEFFGLNDVDLIPCIEDGQICFKHKNGRRGVFKTGM